MFTTKRWYAVHRWIALIVSLQLLAWSSGGLVFSYLDIDNVHGDTDATKKLPVALAFNDVHVTPSEAVEHAAVAGIETQGITRVLLRRRLERTVFVLYGSEKQPLATVDASSGAVLDQITEDQAANVALADFVHDARLRSVEYLEGEAPLEYRGGVMPVYRVMLDHPKEPHFYISPATGDVLKRRNRPWRIFDFFWMLHIMDYGQRESFNHWLLTGMSLLAMATSGSGLALWMRRWRIRAKARAILRG